MLKQAVRTAAGLALGTVSALAHVVALVVAAVALLIPQARPGVAAAAVRLAELERRRVTALLRGVEAGSVPDGGRAMRYLVARVPAGLLGGTILFLIGFGLVGAATMLWSWLTDTAWVLDHQPSEPITGRVIALNVLPGIVLLYLGLTGAAGVARWERALLRRLLAATREEQLARRVEALAESRAAVVAAVDDERRRIERDLHDGVQQRVVALGMLLGRARRHPERATELVEQAHEEAQRVLTDLRDVSWRIYPAVLDTGGLAAALDSVAERAPLPVRITCTLDVEPPVPVRAAAWFVVCEAVNNAAKHSAASAVTVAVRGEGSILCAEVRDDGVGGADPAGGGLAGLARRVAAADGTFSVSSPPGGPTVVRAELPCA
ncbi:sensor histidine kinase [Pseudonocardia sp. TRM90224]|uniref:sensor histidine kinase n=1 Tax=Pseudonocardia sp. TRM90224 TaxID=2812678 RepID=UPI0027E1619C|nr:histidine kinase [Pseudonocardia sp. TRM90224]